MAHVRKEIRKILDEMGYRNNFVFGMDGLDGFENESVKCVTIKNWSPDPQALELKKKIENTVGEDVVVCFQVAH